MMSVDAESEGAAEEIEPPADVSRETSSRLLAAINTYAIPDQRKHWQEWAKEIEEGNQGALNVPELVCLQTQNYEDFVRAIKMHQSIHGRYQDWDSWCRNEQELFEQWSSLDSERASMVRWPFDAVCVHSADTCEIHAGSIASAVQITSFKIVPHLVIRLHGTDLDEPRDKAIPRDWTKFMTHKGVFKCLSYALAADPTPISRGPALFLQKTEVKNVLSRILSDVQHLIGNELQRVRPVHIFVHCSDATNRTCGTVCAMLVGMYGLTVEVALDKFLTVRSSGRPFFQREYMLEALIEWERQLSESNVHNH